MNIKIFAFLPPFIFLAIATVFYFGMQQGDTGLKSTLIGNAPREIASTPVEGYPTFDNSIFNEDVVLVNFWASWCPPCREEHDDLLELAKSNIPIVGVNLKDSQSNANKFLTKYENPFSQLSFDKLGRTAIDWGVTAPPETFVVKNGVVIHRHAGPIQSSEINKISNNNDLK